MVIEVFGATDFGDGSLGPKIFPSKKSRSSQISVMEVSGLQMSVMEVLALPLSVMEVFGIADFGNGSLGAADLGDGSFRRSG